MLRIREESLAPSPMARFFCWVMTWPEYLRWLILFAVAAGMLFYVFSGAKAIRDRAALCKVVADIYVKLPLADRKRLVREFDQAGECLD